MRVGGRSTLPAAILLGLTGLAVLAYVVSGYASALATANAASTISPVGLIYAAVAVSVLITAWGVWQHRPWARTPGRIMGLTVALAGFFSIAYLISLAALAPDTAQTAVAPLGGGGLLAILAGAVVWWSAGAVGSGAPDA